MDYTKTVWQNGTTPLNANNMNKIEDAIEGLNDDKVDKDGTKVLSDNNYSTIEKTKLENIEDGAQVNTVTGIKGDSESDYRTGNINISKANIGLGNTENTSDADKPISTATQAALNLKANSADVYNKTEIDNKISSVYKYKGSVASYANLPVSGNTVGDVWNVNDTNMNYGWTENSIWDPLGSSADLSNYYNKSEINASLNGKQATLVSGTNIKTINGTSLLGSENIVIEGSKPKSTKITLSSATTTFDFSTKNITIAENDLIQIYPASGSETLYIAAGITSYVENNILTIVQSNVQSGLEIVITYTSGNAM